MIFTIRFTFFTMQFIPADRTLSTTHDADIAINPSVATLRAFTPYTVATLLILKPPVRTK